MILPPGMDIRNGVIGDHLRWPNATLIYSLDRNFSQLYSIISQFICSYVQPHGALNIFYIDCIA